MEILKVENLSFTYPLADKPTIENISFCAEKGDFTVVCGATGSGKTTLLRMLKPELEPLGTKTGEVRFCGEKCGIGYVMQNPEHQLVTDKVWHELAFGLENLGLEREAIRRRVAEMACYFGIEEWFDKSVAELSGGQKQLLNLAAVMVMQPQILILDEPTAQLDPIAASDFIQTLKKLNRELALTVIIAEHRLEEAVPISDKMLVLSGGKLLKYGLTRDAVSSLRGVPELLCAMPAAVRLFSGFDIKEECPLSVNEGRRFIERNFGNVIKTPERDTYTFPAEKAVEFSDVCFRYERALPDVLRRTCFTVYCGEIFCVLGGNGSGKTTALGAAAGLNRIYAGEIKIFGKKIKDYKNQSLYRGCLSYLPQDVQTVFLKNTVREELAEVGNGENALPYSFDALLDKHPYDISGGEQQLVAMAKVMATQPRLLLLDEPTKGLDAYTKSVIADILKKLKARGVTVLIVTHDIEFASLCADRCAMFFRGEVTAADVPQRFFAENNFYTTPVSRMTRGYYDGAVTIEDARRLCLANAGKRADS